MLIFSSQVLHIIKIIIQMVAVQFKDKKHILICFIIANVLSAAGYLLLGAYTGLIACSIAMIQTIIQYIYDNKNKEVPKSIILIYIISSCIGGMYTYKTLIDILPIISLVMNSLSLLQKDSKHVRVYTLLKYLAWIPYDAYKLAIVSLIGRLMTISSAIIGMIRFHEKENNQKSSIFKIFKINKSKSQYNEL